MLPSTAKWLSMRIPAVGRLIAERDRLLAQQQTLLDRLNQQNQPNFLSSATESAAFELFKGEWASNIPGLGLGSAALFDDPRLKWLGEQLGGFAGKRILELGPLEGGHSYMMARAGAARLIAIEANVRAFLKCLIVKNAFKFDADFWLGDFRSYLATTTDCYDFVLASGVLYHMASPVQLLADIARVAPAFGIWTHYYDGDVINQRPDLKKRFATEPAILTFRNLRVTAFEQRYSHPEGSLWFRGAPVRTSYWLTKESLFAVLNALGVSVTVHEDTKDHPNGPALLLYASTSRSGEINSGSK